MPNALSPILAPILAPIEVDPLAQAQGVGGAQGPRAMVLPTPPYSATGNVLWLDFAKTYADALGVAQPSLNKDLIGYNSVSSWLDMSGSGNEVLQGDKSLQMLAGLAGPINSGAGQVLVCSNGGLVTGLSKFSFWFRAKLRGDLYGVLSTARTLLYISEGPNSGTVIGVPTIANGGSGYAVGDYVVGTGGTATQQCVLKVASVSGGAITAVTVVNSGTYTVLPTSPLSQGSTSGSGTSATFNVTLSPIGGGTAAQRVEIAVSGGANNRKLFCTLSNADGSQESTSTTLGPQLPDSAFATFGIEGDLAAQTINFYVNSTTPTYQVTGFPVAPGAFGTRDSVLVQLGDNSASARPSYTEFAALAGFNNNSDATRLAALKTYLDAAA